MTRRPSAWTAYAVKHPFARLRILGVLDLVVAVFALAFVGRFGVTAQADTRPPTCYNAMSNEIDCSLETPLKIAQYLVFFLVLFGLLAYQVYSGRKLRA